MYLRPSNLNEALAALRQGPCDVLAGGTDYYPSLSNRAPAGRVLDISAIAALRGISDAGDHWRIGATTTWTDVIEARLPALFNGLKLASREVGGMQIQNSGTLAGNLCNASPAADGVPALLALDAGIELSSAGQVRMVPLEQFIAAPRRTLRREDELVSAIRVPKPRAGRSARGHFLKLGARRYLVISIAMAAVAIETEDGTVREARVAIGACSPVAHRLHALEMVLTGKPADAELGAFAQAAHLSQLDPIDDVRADRAYRLDAALTLVRRALSEVAS